MARHGDEEIPEEFSRDNLQPSMNYPWYDDKGKVDAMLNALRGLPDEQTPSGDRKRREDK